MSTSLRIAVMVAFCALSTNLLAQEGRGRIASVTLFRNQAQVVRHYTLDGAEGPREFVAQELPDQISPGTLFAEPEEGVEIRAVRFRSRAVATAPQREVREVEARIEAIAAEMRALAAKKGLLGHQLNSLERMIQFTGASGGSDLKRGVLDAEALERIVLFSFERRQKLSEQVLEVDEKERTLKKEHEFLQKKRAELGQGKENVIREAVVHLVKTKPGKARFRLGYIVGQCSWSPSYNLRAAADRESVAVEYDALITQMSGEDWKDVELTLSTATPQLSADGPGLAPFSLSAGAAVQPRAATAMGAYMKVRGRQQVAQAQIQRGTNLRDNFDNSWAANTAANDLQTFELNASGVDLAGLREVDRDLEQATVDYALSAKVSLPSRHDRQMVRITRAKLNSEFHNEAIPLLSNLVYRKARLQNTSGTLFLSGPVNVFMGRRYVGRSEMVTVAQGQSFVVGFGADPQLRASRTLVSRKEAIQGGNKRITTRFRLRVDNFGERKVAVRVLDRIPTSEREQEIKVTLEEMSVTLSEDETYREEERPSGILRWDLEAASNGQGAKPTVIDFGYTVEHSRQLSLQNPVNKQQQKYQREFELMQRRRGKR